MDGIDKPGLIELEGCSFPIAVPMGPQPTYRSDSPWEVNVDVGCRLAQRVSSRPASLCCPFSAGSIALVFRFVARGPAEILRGSCSSARLSPTTSVSGAASCPILSPSPSIQRIVAYVPRATDASPRSARHSVGLVIWARSATMEVVSLRRRLACWRSCPSCLRARRTDIGSGAGERGMRQC